MKNRIKDLNLIDNFLFGSVVECPDIGEEFVRLLLKLIFNRDFGKLQIVPEKDYKGADTDLHGVRLDVYVEAAPDDSSEDAAALKSGKGYQYLRETIVVMTMPFDPFGRDRIKYTMQVMNISEAEKRLYKSQL